MRLGEIEGFEYHFTNYAGMLQKTFANDFAYLERWGDFYSGIEACMVEEALEETKDGILLASVSGAEYLQTFYGNQIIPLYLWPGPSSTLRNPSCMQSDFVHVVEIKRRIRLKLIGDGFSEFETVSSSAEDFLEKRMVDNYLDIAAANGRIRSGEQLVVVEDPPDRPDMAADRFEQIRTEQPMTKTQSLLSRGSKCFVLMPFSDEMRPIYEDHIVKACQSRGITATRADQIFSTRAVMEDVLDSVKEAHYVIADVTGWNANVFYEIGVCHALGKEVILLTQDDEVPFDIRHLRRIRYDFTPRGMKRLEEMLIKTIDSARCT
jgi:nucleoside 2-deoxyribosyltransferase